VVLQVTGRALRTPPLAADLYFLFSPAGDLYFLTSVQEDALVSRMGHHQDQLPMASYG
jgi:hypothetical protein